MRLIVGLGNPDIAYDKTRHNVGFMFVDELKNSRTKELQNVRVFKSDQFMNDSGLFVKKLLTTYHTPLTDLYVVHDDLDIKLGEYKIQFGKGPKDHNGLKSINQELGTDQYWHVRVGVDNRDLENRTKGEEYVLQDFTEEERLILEKVVKEICEKLTKI